MLAERLLAGSPYLRIRAEHRLQALDMLRVKLEARLRRLGLTPEQVAAQLQLLGRLWRNSARPASFTPTGTAAVTSSY